MGYEIGELVIGEVIKVKPYALFLSFENGSQALLHISEISDGFIRDIEKFGTVGDKLKVKVLHIDETNGFMRVSLKQVPQEECYSTHENNKRRSLGDNDSEFKMLEEKLPGWIESTLKKAEENK